AAAWFARLYGATVGIAGVEAVAVKRPGLPFATKAGELASPAAFVTALACAPPPRNAAPAPDTPAPSEKTTVTPCTGTPSTSSTRAVSGAPKTAFTVADWLVP